ncbi:MAG: hypothetical protein QF486_02370 [Candidatus Woesearchaeota archaeon]|jgi:hypothetical protein|nr:hypothetical protein [Candidatus Woesearchaeota archaeon]MDP7198439.1 hypothetical protein [Candidatus Woesearchaeota archaeon]MDP7466819.1 hypothetical protein [Candidatus Woesearchaeota archaeon]MDP7648044.1 hypothetical protein [Candidatus Woesearchaeota archaeon]
MNREREWYWRVSNIDRSVMDEDEAITVKVAVKKHRIHGATILANMDSSQVYVRITDGRGQQRMRYWAGAQNRTTPYDFEKASPNGTCLHPVTGDGWATTYRWENGD